MGRLAASRKTRVAPRALVTFMSRLKPRSLIRALGLYSSPGTAKTCPSMPTLHLPEGESDGSSPGAAEKKIWLATSRRKPQDASSAFRPKGCPMRSPLPAVEFLALLAPVALSRARHAASADRAPDASLGAGCSAADPVPAERAVAGSFCGVTVALGTFIVDELGVMGPPTCVPT